jgi:hypothetical protein
VDRIGPLCLALPRQRRDLKIKPIIVSPVWAVLVEELDPSIATTKLSKFVSIDGPSVGNIFDHDDLVIAVPLQKLLEPQIAVAFADVFPFKEVHGYAPFDFK